MSIKKIILCVIGLYLVFALAYVGIMNNSDTSAFFGEDSSGINEDIESNEIEVSDDDIAKAKTTYYPFEEAGVVGYKNLLGEVIQAPRYNSGSMFYNGVATVEFDNTNFVINNEFQVISENFDKIEPLMDSYFSAERVVDGEDKLYLINPDGKSVEVNGDYLRCNDSYGDTLEGCFILVNKGKEGLIDTAGKVIVDAIYSEILVVSKVDDEFRIWANKLDDQVLLSENGEIKTEYKIKVPGKFNDGLASVIVEKDNGYEYKVFVDIYGKEVKFFKEYRIDYLSNFSEGMMLLNSNDNTLVCINENLEIVFEIKNPNYENTYEIEKQYENGVAIVSKRQGNNFKQCYEIDIQGNILGESDYKTGLVKLDDGNYMASEYKAGKIKFSIYNKDYNLMSDEKYIGITDKGQYILAQGKSNLDIYYKGIKVNVDKCNGIDSEFVSDNIIKVSDSRGNGTYYTCINGRLEVIDLYEK